MNLATLIPTLLQVSIFLLVFTIGLSATPRDATYLFRNPSQLARLVLAMNIIMPALALALVYAFDFHPAVKIALVVLAVSPVPPLFPSKAMKAGGEENYTIGLLVAASLLAIVFVPLTMGLFEMISARPLHMSAVTVAKFVLTSVLGPLIIGMSVLRIAPKLAAQIAKPVSVFATALLVLALLPALFGAWHAISSLIGDGTLLAFAAFVVAGLAVGHLLGGPRAADRTVLALSTATRHPAVAIGVAHVNFPDQKLVAPAIVLYLLVGAIVSLPYLKWAKHHDTEVPATQT